MKVIEQTKRAKKSRIAKMIRENANGPGIVTVSENAPCKWPGREGWKVEPFVNDQHDYLTMVFHCFTTHGAYEVHIKTATLGGAAKVWYR